MVTISRKLWGREWRGVKGNSQNLTMYKKKKKRKNNKQHLKDVVCILFFMLLSSQNIFKFIFGVTYLLKVQSP